MAAKRIICLLSVAGLAACAAPTDDGTRYALHATDGTKLVKGVRMRIRTERAKVRADCAPGKLVEMIAAEPLR
jgi:hypothetical protein